jgi:hypothetical protein
VKLTSLLFPRGALSELRAELRIQPSRVSATPIQSRSFEHKIVLRENCVFREVFLPLIHNRVSEMAEHIHLLRVEGGISSFAVLIF